ncbi:MAG: cell division protein FtsA [Kiritimatiellae bacterium]|nr:cell division protein FtsA [Kiritimatiellia bacterium]
MGFDPVVALEIGTSNVRALVGEAREDGHLMITGLGECPSRGVRKGEIIDFDNALSCVRSVLDTAEEQSGVAIEEVHLVLSGGHIQSLVNRGMAAVESENREITEDEVENVMDVARAVSLPPDRMMLHSICQHFYVDDQQGVVNPEGMEGSRLSADMLIIHCIAARVRSTIRVVRSAHAGVVDVAFGGLCSALAVLTGEQKESGAVVLDLGAGTSDYLAYAGQAIACAGSLAVGGDHITNDIALGLSLPMSQAEQLKIETGEALVEPRVRTQSISLPAEGGFPGRYVRVGDLNTIINVRMEETLEMIRLELEKHGVLGQLGAGVILTGGGAQLRAVTKLAEKVFDMPCVLGRPRGVSGLAVVTEGPAYAAPIGVIQYAYKTGKQGEEPGLFDWFTKLFRRK